MNKIRVLLLSCIVAYGSVNAMERFPLCEAIKAGNVELVTSLLRSNHGDVEKKDGDGETPLNLAAIRGNLKIIELLLAYGANPNVQGQSGYTTLICAAQRANSDMVKLLLAYGADANIKDYVYGATALWWAAAKGYLEIVKILSDSGADINLKDQEGRTPLDLARQNRQMAVVEFLSPTARAYAELGINSQELSPVELPYAILGLKKGDDRSQAAINRAYHKLALKWHPDKNLGKDTTEIIKVINDAYEKLKK